MDVPAIEDSQVREVIFKITRMKCGGLRHVGERRPLEKHGELSGVLENPLIYTAGFPFLLPWAWGHGDLEPHGQRELRSSQQEDVAKRSMEEA